MTKVTQPYVAVDSSPSPKSLSLPPVPSLPQLLATHLGLYGRCVASSPGGCHLPE